MQVCIYIKMSLQVQENRIFYICNVSDIRGSGVKILRPYIVLMYAGKNTFR
jgi:hypothetical protein